MENGLGEAFSNVSLVGSLDQLVSVLLVWDDTSTPGDLRTTTVPAGVKTQHGLLKTVNSVFKLRSPAADILCRNTRLLKALKTYFLFQLLTTSNEILHQHTFKEKNKAFSTNLKFVGFGLKR